MAKPTSRIELKDYCLHKLGFPVIEINVEDDQVEDRIDDAFQIFFDYHYDGVERNYYAHEITQPDIDNGYIYVPASMIHVTRVLPFSGANGSIYPMGDPSLAWDFTTTNIFGGMGGGADGAATISDQAGRSGTGFDRVGYMLNMQLFEEIQNMFGGEVPMAFSRHTDRVYLNTNWNEIPVGHYLVVEGWSSLDPDIYTDVYNDRWLKRYCTAAIKQQWGANLIKYSGIMLPGGVTLDGDKLFESASSELDKLEEEIQTKYEEPPTFYMA